MCKYVKTFSIENTVAEKSASSEMPLVNHKEKLVPVHPDAMDLIPVISHYKMQWKEAGKLYLVPVEKGQQKSASVMLSMNAKRCVIHAIKMRLSECYRRRNLR